VGFFGSLLTGANAVAQGVSGYAQAKDFQDQRARQQQIEDQEREAKKRRDVLEMALLELRADNERQGPQPTFDVGPTGTTVRGVTDPTQAKRYGEQFRQPEAPQITLRRPTAEGDYSVAGSPGAVRGAMGGLPPMVTPPEPVTQGERRSDSVINSIVSGFRSETTDHRDAASGYAALKGAYDQLATGNPAAAIGMLFAYGKILDPGSVVREGELRTLQNIGAYDQRVKNWMKQATEGTMSDEVARGIMNVAENTLRQRAQAFGDVRQNALQRGELQGVSREELEQIIPDYYRRAFEGDDGAGQAPGARTTPPTGTIGKEPWQVRADELRAAGLSPQQIAVRLRIEGLIQ
jgi:hypothetical protein